MERTKRPALLALARIFVEANVPYAIIGGVALQVHQTEPRTTLGIDVAVATYGQLPRAQLEAAGFTWSGQFSHSENWIGPEGTPVQFTDDLALADAITRAEDVAARPGTRAATGHPDRDNTPRAASRLEGKGVQGWSRCSPLALHG